MIAARLTRRSGFTLLEVLLAAAIGAVLMGALYAALNMQVRFSQAGRDQIEHALLVRSLLNRIASEIRLSLAPTIPLPTSTASSSGGGASSGGASAAGGASGAASTGGASGMSGSSSSTSGASGGASTTGAASSAVQFNLGVQGQSNQITLFISRLATDVDPTADNPVLGCDLRRIDFWLANDGTQNRGLCRNEFRPITSDDALNYVPPPMPEDTNLIIAEEVRSLQFQYWDGTQWQDTWDGTAPGADGVTPQGPPVAIKITLGVLPPGTDPNQQGTPELKSYVHVVALPTANGTSAPPAAATTPTGN